MGLSYSVVSSGVISNGYHMGVHAGALDMEEYWDHIAELKECPQECFRELENLCMLEALRDFISKGTSAVPQRLLLRGVAVDILLGFLSDPELKEATDLLFESVPLDVYDICLSMAMDLILPKLVEKAATLCIKKLNEGVVEAESMDVELGKSHLAHLQEHGRKKCVESVRFLMECQRRHMKGETWQIAEKAICTEMAQFQENVNEAFARLEGSNSRPLKEPTLNPSQSCEAGPTRPLSPRAYHTTGEIVWEPTLARRRVHACDFLFLPL
eukprot:jgi/Botrbrau1/14467/Bobra.0014s0105.1